MLLCFARTHCTWSKMWRVCDINFCGKLFIKIMKNNTPRKVHTGMHYCTYTYLIILFVPCKCFECWLFLCVCVCVRNTIWLLSSLVHISRGLLLKHSLHHLVTVTSNASCHDWCFSNHKSLQYLLAVGGICLFMKVSFYTGIFNLSISGQCFWNEEYPLHRNDENW